MNASTPPTPAHTEYGHLNTPSNSRPNSANSPFQNEPSYAPKPVDFSKKQNTYGGVEPNNASADLPVSERDQQPAAQNRVNVGQNGQNMYADVGAPQQQTNKNQNTNPRDTARLSVPVGPKKDI